MNTDWIYNYNQPATPEIISQVLDTRPTVWALPEEWDWYVFLLEQLALRTTQSSVEDQIFQALQVAINMRGKVWQFWNEIKKDAETQSGAKVLPTPEVLKGGLSRAFIDTIYVPAIKSRGKIPS
jgi:hypothetical protein